MSHAAVRELWAQYSACVPEPGDRRDWQHGLPGDVLAACLRHLLEDAPTVAAARGACAAWRAAADACVRALRLRCGEPGARAGAGCGLRRAGECSAGGLRRLERGTSRMGGPGSAAAGAHQTPSLLATGWPSPRPTPSRRRAPPEPSALLRFVSLSELSLRSTQGAADDEAPAAAAMGPLVSPQTAGGGAAGRGGRLRAVGRGGRLRAATPRACCQSPASLLTIVRSRLTTAAAWSHATHCRRLPSRPPHFSAPLASLLPLGR
jgi:hypothetical protein